MCRLLRTLHRSWQRRRKRRLMPQSCPFLCCVCSSQQLLTISHDTTNITTVAPSPLQTRRRLPHLSPWVRMVTCIAPAIQMDPVLSRHRHDASTGSPSRTMWRTRAPHAVDELQPAGAESSLSKKGASLPHGNAATGGLARPPTVRPRTRVLHG